MKVEKEITRGDWVVLYIIGSASLGSCLGGGMVADAGHIWTGLVLVLVGCGLLSLFGLVWLGFALSMKGPS